MAEITGNGGLVSGLGGASGYGEIRLMSGDDIIYRVDVSAVFENGLTIGDTTYDASLLEIDLNGIISLGPTQPGRSWNGGAAYDYVYSGIGNMYYAPLADGSAVTVPIIAPFAVDFVSTQAGSSIWVDVDPVGDVVTITWDSVVLYNERYSQDAQRYSFQVQLYDRGIEGFDVVLRYDETAAHGALDSYSRAGINFGEAFWASPTGSSSARIGVTDLDSTAGNTGVTGLWVYEYRSIVDTLEVGPVAVATEEDTSVTFTAAELLANSSTERTEGLSIAALGPVTGGTATLEADGSVTFVPDPDFNGEVTFVMSVTDGAFTETTEVTVTIDPVNDAPVARDDMLDGTVGGTSEYAAAVLLGNDVDVDGDTLTITSVSAIAGGTPILQDDGSVRFAAEAGYTGVASFSYTVSDGNGGEATATAQIALAEVTSEIILRDLDGTQGLILEGATSSSDGSGSHHQVVFLGDVNGDGIDDLGMAQRLQGYLSNGTAMESNNFVLFGSTDFSALIEVDRRNTLDIINLETLDGTAGFRLSPIATGNGTNLGHMAGVGDIDGDGFDDFMVSFSGAAYNGVNSAGISYLVLGGSSYAAQESITTVGDGSSLFYGTDSSDRLASIDSGSIDFNGDGHLDLVIGTGGYGDTGGVAIWYGDGTPFAASQALGSADLIIAGQTQASTWAGSVIATGGDVNGDGFDDLLISRNDGMYLVYGRAATGTLSLSALDETGSPSGLGDATGLSLMTEGDDVSLDFIGDVNGDGYDDFAVGESEWQSGTGLVGRVMVFYGGPDMLPNLLDPNSLDGSNGFILEGTGSISSWGSYWPGTGYQVTALGDVNGDGIDDFATVHLGAYFNGTEDDGAGAVYVVYGSADGFPASLNVASLDGTFGFRIDGDYDPRSPSSFVTSSIEDVAGGGDLNGDGLNDIAISTTSDLVYVVYGFENGIAQGVPRPVADSFDTYTTAPLTLVADDLLGNDLADSLLTLEAVTGAVGGTATLNPDGTVSFTPDAGFTGTASFAYAVSDAEGNTATGTVSVIVTEEPVDATLSADTLTGTLSEQGGPTEVRGYVTVTDPNTGEAALVSGSYTGLYGTFTVQPDGLWRYRIDRSAGAFDTLGEGETALETMAITSVDGSATATLQVTIEGADEVTLTLAGDSFEVSQNPENGSAFGVEAAAVGNTVFIGWTYTAGDSWGTSANAIVLRMDGSPVLIERQINPVSTGDQRDFQIAATNGRWFTAFEDSSSLSGWDIGLQSHPYVFGGRYETSEDDLAALTDPDLQALAGGGFVLVGKEMGSSSAEIFVRLYDDTGTPTSDRITVATVGQTDGDPSIAQLADGSFVVAYTDGGNRISVQTLSATGQPTGSEQDLGIYSNNASRATVTALEGGGYVVAWDMAAETGGVAAMVFDAEGTQVGETLTFDATSDMALGHSVTALLDGGFAIAWARLEVGGAFEVMVQAVDAEGLAAGDPLLAGTIVGPELFSEDFFYILPVSLVGDGEFGLSVYFPQFNTDLNVIEIVGQHIAIDLPIPLATSDDSFILFEGAPTDYGLNVLDNDTGFNMTVTEVDGVPLGATGRLELTQPYGTLIIYESGSVRLIFDDATDSFDRGDVENLTFTLTVQDASGETTTSKLDLTVHGDSSEDSVAGTDGADDMRMAEGNDSVDAGAGNDTLSGGAGDDTLNGGEGIDTAVLSGAYADYSFGLTDAGHTIIDELTLDGDDGTDTLVSIEQLAFSDGTTAAAGRNGFGFQWTFRDLSGARIGRVTFDDTETHSWHSREDMYDASGQRTAIETLSDNGDRQFVTLDPETQAFRTLTFEDLSNSDPRTASYTDTYVDGLLSERLTIEDDGDTVHSRFYSDGTRSHATFSDLSDSFGFASVEDTFDSSGARDTRDMLLDSGDRSYFEFTDGVITLTRLTDGDDDRDWHTYENRFDATGALVSRLIVEDDGDTQSATFTDGVATEVRFADLGTDDQFWEELVFVYDTTGALLRQEILYDDTADTLVTYYEDSVRTVVVYTDVDGSSPWETRTDHYAADGETLETRTFGYADGSETVVDYL